MRWTFCLACCLLGAILVGSQQPTQAPLAAERLLSDFRNDDGSRPDGRKSLRDDSSALQKALNAGPGLVRIGPGHFLVSNVSIPAGVTLIGTGEGTVLQAQKAQPVIKQDGFRDWRLRDVCLQGEADERWKERTDQGAHGLVIERCCCYEVSGVIARNFAGVGVQIKRLSNPQTALPDGRTPDGVIDGGTFDRITAHGNFIGIRFDDRAEYSTATNLTCYHNQTGLVIHAGNTNVSSSNIGDNVDGILIEDKPNGSHGSITGCIVNHNARYAILGKGIVYGMAISNCCVFYGTIRLENCRGANITSGLLSCSISTEGPDCNRFAGNHVVLEPQFQFEFAPATLVEDNFTKSGPWEHNRPAKSP